MQTYVQFLRSVPISFSYVRPAQIKQGAKFVSDTDTEVIPKLCEYIFRNLQEPLPLNEVRWYLALRLPAQMGLF